MAVHLHAESADSDTISWRVGPGLVRHTGTVGTDDAPAPLRGLFESGVIAEASTARGRIDTRLGAGRSPAVDGPAIRSALYEVLSADGGWPDPTGETSVARAADDEIAVAVADVLAGDFGEYTATHGGSVELVGVANGIVSVKLAGQCHGCAAADHTLKGNLAIRLASIPGFVDLVVAGDRECGGLESRDAPRRGQRSTWMPIPRIRRRSL